MKLLFDCTELSYFNDASGHRAGVFNVALNLFKELEAKGVDFSFYCDYRRYYFMKDIKEFSHVELLAENSLMNKFWGLLLYKTRNLPLRIKYAILILSRYYDKYFYKSNLKNRQNLKHFDAYFSPFTPPSREIQESNMKKFRMLHDIIPILEKGMPKSPKDWHYKIYNTINKDDYYLTNSECTRKDVLKYFPFVKEENIKISLDDHLGEKLLQIYPEMIPLMLYYYKAAVIHY